MPATAKRTDLAKVKPHPQNPNFPLTYDKPKSVCGCGHSGDGPNSQHAATEFGTPGHGECNEDCACAKFRWAGWTKDYSAVLKHLRKRAAAEGNRG